MNILNFPIRYRSVLFAGFAFVGFSSTAADRYSLDSFVISGGGGRSNPMSAHDRFAVTGTVGQMITAPILRSPDKRYRVEAGFWQGIGIVETPEAPTLSIRLGLRDTAILSWPVNTSGFVLEETESLGIRREWTVSLNPVVNTATEHTVAVPRTGIMKLYRLRKL